MRAHTVNRTFKLSGVVACIAVLIAAMPAEARTGSDRSINLAGRQQMLVEQMTAQTVLVAMGIDQEQHIRQLSAARDLFDRTHSGLRHGDRELGLAATSNPEVLETLDRVSENWSDFDSVIGAIIASGAVTDDQVRLLTNLNSRLLRATERMSAAYTRNALGGRGHTILSQTINVSAHQSMLGQRMLRQASLVAYGYQVERHRAELAETSDRFNRSLSGLIRGDAELRLIAAPTPEIAGELEKVQRIWLRILPVVESVAAGEAIDRDPVSEVARYVQRMIGPLNVAVLMYESL